MSHLDVPHFPRGFVLSERPIEAPPTFVPGPILSNFYVHPWTHIETAGDAGLFVIILGHCVPTRTELPADTATHLLAQLQAGEGRFLQELADYGGRHAIIFGSKGNIRVVNDATAMRSVFYAAAGGVVASNAQLVEQALGGVTEDDGMPFRYGYPGNRTPYARTRVLTANTYYWMTANVIRRFWPIMSPAPRTVEEAAEELLDASANALKAMARGKSVALTLTAGLDSRSILAIALHAGVPVDTYTYGDNHSTKVDRLMGGDLANMFGLEHTVISERIEDPVLKRRLGEAVYSSHHGRWVGALRKHFIGKYDVAVLGNALEIGRSNYTPQRNRGAAAPVTADSMAGLHHMKVGKEVDRLIDEFGADTFHKASRDAFQAFIDDTGFDVVAGMLDPFDQFYWEHRMATWQGVAMSERDFYAEPFIPYNSRRVFEAMLGAPFASRRADEAALRMVEMVDPRLLEFPINPKTWSRPKAVQLGLRASSSEHTSGA